MILVTAADSNYFTQVAVLCESLNRTQTVPVDLHVVGSGWTSELKEKVRKIANVNFSLTFHNVNSDDFKEIKLSHGFPLATAYNLMSPKFFVNNVERFIYLDADMVVTDDLSPIWNLSFKEAVAAVTDSHIGVLGNPSMWRPWREEGCTPMAKYLNTGVMVIQVTVWNKLEITEKCFDLLKKYEMPCIDQDALSITLNGNFHSLKPRYNLMPYHMMPKLRYCDLVESATDIRDAIQNPAIIHFHRSFFGKPWNFGCSHPNVELWRNLADKSDPNWRKKLKLIDFAKEKMASLIGMSAADQAVDGIRELKI